MACTGTACTRTARAFISLLFIVAVSSTRNAAVYFEGRLLVLDQLHPDGSHQSRYLLYASSPEQRVLTLASCQMLTEYNSNDVVKVLLQAAPRPTGKKSIRSLLVSTDDCSQADPEHTVVGIRLLERADATQQPAQSIAQPLPVGSHMLASQLPCSKSSSHISSRMLQAPAPMEPVYARTPKVVSDMPAIYYILDMCGLGGGPAASVQDFNSTVVANGLPFYMSACSHGIASMTPSNSRVVNITLPCNGTLSTGQSWTATSCDGGNLVNLARAVDEYARNKLGIDHTQYRHHALILPRNLPSWMGSSCSWVGTAVVGLANPAYSYAWISGDVWDKPQIYMHEFSHNYNVGHSNKLAGAPTVSNPLQEPAANLGSHADWSSAMGFCCSTRCLHAAHSWQMGWSQALATLTSYDINGNSTLTFFVPSQLSTRKNFLTVTTDWVVAGLAATTIAAGPPSNDGGQPAATYASEVPAAEACLTTPLGKRSSQEGTASSPALEQLYAASNGAQSSTAPSWGTSTIVAADVSSAAPANSSTSSSTANAVFPAQHTFWISWRPQAAPYDMPGYGYQDGLLIHLYDGASQSDGKDTFLQSLLTDAGQTWTDVHYGSGLVVQLISANFTGATVSISRINMPVPASIANSYQGQGVPGSTQESPTPLSPPAAASPSPSPPPPPPPSARPRKSPASPRPPKAHHHGKKRS